MRFWQFLLEQSTSLQFLQCSMWSSWSVRQSMEQNSCLTHRIWIISETLSRITNQDQSINWSPHKSLIKLSISIIYWDPALMQKLMKWLVSFLTKIRSWTKQKHFYSNLEIVWLWRNAVDSEILGRMTGTGPEHIQDCLESPMIFPVQLDNLKRYLLLKVQSQVFPWHKNYSPACIFYFSNKFYFWILF